MAEAATGRRAVAEHPAMPEQLAIMQPRADRCCASGRTEMLGVLLRRVPSVLAEACP